MKGTDTTGLVFDRRLPGQPGTHALIVGIDDYPHLERGTGALDQPLFILPPLSSAVRSALAFHYWLVNRAQLAVPLTTCRLLLAPRANEEQGLPIPPPAAPSTTDDFVTAATGWMEDARRSDAEMTIFYFCGHKLEVSREEDILLFQNFGSSLGPSFRGAVSFVNIFNGMAPSGGPMAQTQLYFLDGSRHPFTRPSLGLRLYGTTNVFDVLLGGLDQRSAAVFHASAPGQQAYARANEVSLFTAALIEALDGAAAVPQSLAGAGENEWAVTIGSLSRWLGVAGARLGAAHNVPITFMTSGRLSDSVIAKIHAVPNVDVQIYIEPAEAARDLTLGIDDQHGKRVVDIPDLSPVQHVRLAAGFYSLDFLPRLPDSNAKPNRRLVQVLPPSLIIVVDVSA